MTQAIEATLENTTTAADLLALGAAFSAPRQADDGAPFVVVPEGYSVKELEKLLPSPTRKSGTVTLHSAASFIDYINTHKAAGSVIYATDDPAKFVAVLNDHSRDETGWGDHRAIYECPVAHEWKTWIGSNKKAMPQAEFAQFIEDNLPNVITPEPATLLEVSRHLSAKKKVNYSSGIRLDNGQVQLTYEEDIQGTVGKGQLRVPEIFTLGIPVFKGTAAYKLDARLRYRISDSGQLTLWYDLLRPHLVLEDAFKNAWAEIAEKTGVTILHGTY